MFTLRAEAMRMMIEGDVWELYIPSELAYGDAGVAGIPGMRSEKIYCTVLFIFRWLGHHLQNGVN
jgi:hypothetical protein